MEEKSVEEMNSNIIKHKYLGFNETLGPKRINPAPKPTLPIWIDTLNKWITEESSNPNITTKLDLLLSMKKYPTNSNIENYILLDNFITNIDIEEIIGKICSIIGEKKHVSLETVKLELFSEINHRKFLCLLVFYSRNLKQSYFTINPVKKLSNLLENYFFKIYPVDQDDISLNIKQIFLEFIQKEKIITIEFINGIKNGDYVYKIYKNGYAISKNINNNSFEEEKKQLFIKHMNDNITQQICVERVNTWITTDIYIAPINYFFNINSIKENNILIKENELCREIAEIQNNITNYDTSNHELTKTIFSDIDINIFEENIGPAINSILKSNTLKSTTLKANNKIKKKSTLSSTFRKSGAKSKPR